MSRKIYLTESQVQFLKENVYVSSLKGNKAYLTYNQNSYNYNHGTQNNKENLKTDKMDMDNGDTYELKLKDGTICYNITSIKGVEIMHYFKHLWNNQKTTMLDKDMNEYELTMLKQDEEKFINRFIKKVSFVIKAYEQEHQFTPDTITILPIPSSSNFNNKMAELLSGMNINGKAITKVSDDFIRKSIETLRRDSEFIERNKDYYNGYFFIGKPDSKSVNDYIDFNLNKVQSLNKIRPLVDELDVCAKNIFAIYYRYNHSASLNKVTEKMTNALVNSYIDYYNSLMKIMEEAKFNNNIDNKESKMFISKVIQPIKYAKGPSVDKRSEVIWTIVKPYLKNKTCPVNNKPYTKVDIVEWQPLNFQIKNLSNAERMGMRGYFNIEQEKIENEIKAIKNNLIIIFDDNISGGATMSDVVLSLKEAGISNILPITFGEMQEKWVLGPMSVRRPEGSNNRHSVWR